MANWNKINSLTIFASLHQSWDEFDWSKIIYSDETKLHIFSQSRKSVRRGQKEKFLNKNPTVKFCPSIMVCGAIRADGKRIIIKCEGNVTSHEYQRTFSEDLPFIYKSYYILQHDGAPFHTSSSTKLYLANKFVRLACSKNW